MIEDRKLTEHFSLYELTTTNVAHLQEMNRNVTESQIQKLWILAHLAEDIREFLMVPLKITSGYRCLDLNQAIGSTNRSQHLLCEAIDFVPIGMDIGAAFRNLAKAVREGRLAVGQLIFETDLRPYGYDSWIHCSLGVPFRSHEKCSQVLRMENGIYTFFKEGLV